MNLLEALKVVLCNDKFYIAVFDSTNGKDPIALDYEHGERREVIECSKFDIPARVAQIIADTRTIVSCIIVHKEIVDGKVCPTAYPEILVHLLDK